MAITASLLTSGSHGSGSSATTASVTLNASNFYVAFVQVENSGANSRTHAAITGWTEDKYTGGTDRDAFAMTALARAGNGSTGTLSIGFGGQTQAFFEWQIIELIGINLTGTIVQSYATASVGTSPFVGTLSAFGDATNNAVLVAAGAYSVTAFTAGNVSNIISNATGDLSFGTAYGVGQQTSPSIACVGHNDDWTLYAAEIKAAGGGGASPLRYNSDLNGIGASGPFFRNPLG